MSQIVLVEDLHALLLKFVNNSLGFYEAPKDGVIHGVFVLLKMEYVLIIDSGTDPNPCCPDFIIKLALVAHVTRVVERGLIAYDDQILVFEEL